MNSGAAQVIRALATLHRISLADNNRLLNDLRFVLTKIAELDHGEAERLNDRLPALDAIEQRNEPRRVALEFADEFAGILDAPSEDASERLADLQRRFEELAAED